MNAKSRASGIGQSGDDGSAETDQEEDQHEEHQNHAAQKVAFDSVRGDANEITAIVIRTNLHVGRKQRCG